VLPGVLVVTYDNVPVVELVSLPDVCVTVVPGVVEGTVAVVCVTVVAVVDEGAVPNAVDVAMTAISSHYVLFDTVSVYYSVRCVMVSVANSTELAFALF
jgi:hypothetical protein